MLCAMVSVAYIICMPVNKLFISWALKSQSYQLTSIPDLSLQLIISVGGMVVVVVMVIIVLCMLCGKNTLQHAIMICFSSFVLFSYLCLLQWMRQLLAGMIAEPAFLSEYTIFALDSSIQPKTQSDSVVSPSTAFCIPFVGKQSNLTIVEANLMLLITYHLSKRLRCLVANLALKYQRVNCWNLMAGVLPGGFLTATK